MSKKFSLFDKPLKSLKDAGFKNENHFSDVLKMDILSGIEEIINKEFDSNPVREGDGGDNFSADLVCTITESIEDNEQKSTVIIENQFGRSDHDHLGKCITYGSNRDAKIVIWICEDFGDAHIKSLQWLNEHFKDKVGFYGIQVKAYDHPDSIKIKFETVVQPLDEIFNAEEYTPRQNKIRSIFELAQKEYEKITSEMISIKNAPYKRYFHCFKTKKAYCYWHYFTRESKIMTIMKCRGQGDEKLMMNAWELLEKNKEKIEKSLPNGKWMNAYDDDELGGHRPHIDITTDSVPKNLEGMSDKDIEILAKKMAKDMQSIVDIVKDLKL